MSIPPAAAPDETAGRTPGSEAKRALIGVLLGCALGLLVAVFARRDEQE